MRKLLKRNKEIVFLIGIVFLAGMVSHDLFSEQQQNSGLMNSGTTLPPSNFSGRASCEVPIPSVGDQTVPEETNTLLEKLQDKNPKDKSALQAN